MTFLHKRWRKSDSSTPRKRSGSRSSNGSNKTDQEVEERSPSPAKDGSKLTLRVDAQAVADTAFGALHIAGDVASVPGLKIATGIIENITKLCLNVSRNRNEADLLLQECIDFRKTILEANGQGHGPEYLEAKIKDFVTLLEDIEHSMIEWGQLGYLKSFVYQFAISNGIGDYSRRLNNMKANFGMGVAIVTLIGVHSYQEASRKDRREAVVDLAHQKDANDLRTQASDSSLNGKEVAKAMGRVLKDVDEVDLGEEEREQLETNLFLMSDAAGQLPEELRIPPGMLKFDNSVIAGSTIYDIFRGKYLTQLVAIKKTRSIACTDDSINHIMKEARNWMSACKMDPNEEYILHLIGVSFFKDSFVMVSRWMDNRDAFTYLRVRGDSVDRKNMIRRIAKGLQILHSHNPPIAHGHLKASNIMINHRGEPLLGDFGLSKSLQSITGQPMSDIKGFDSYRWLAPETVGGDTLISQASDIWSFGMTVLEIMTGDVPFKNIRKAIHVPKAVTEGQHPERPTEQEVLNRGLNDELWELLLRFWEKNPSNRPSIFEASEELRTMWP